VHNNHINNLLDLKGVIVKNIVSKPSFIEIHIQTKVKTHKCPACGSLTKRVHDYRYQRIKDIPIQSKNTFLVLRKRRYLCHCGKRFYEKLDFLPRYHRMTNRLSAYIINELKSNYSVTSIANRLNISTHTVNRVFDHIQYFNNTLPEVLSIDEFKGNSGGAKYHCILVDPKSKRVLDILKDRKIYVLTSYFKQFKDRSNVKYFITDMWRPYVDIAKTYFKNALIVIDKFHFIRHNIWAIEGVRKRIQKSMPANLRRYYKRSKKLVLAKYDSLDEESKKQLEIMLLYNDELRQAHYLKEHFYEFTQAKSSKEAKVLLRRWIEMALRSEIKEYVSCAKTYSIWFNEICNSFDVPYTNGCTEGFNNKIKVIKRNAYGFRNFDRFRNRILHCCN